MYFSSYRLFVNVCTILPIFQSSSFSSLIICRSKGKVIKKCPGFRTVLTRNTLFIILAQKFPGDCKLYNFNFSYSQVLKWQTSSDQVKRFFSFEFHYINTFTRTFLFLLYFHIYAWTTFFMWIFLYGRQKSSGKKYVGTYLHTHDIGRSSCIWSNPGIWQLLTTDQSLGSVVENGQLQDSATLLPQSTQHEKSLAQGPCMFPWICEFTVSSKPQFQCQNFVIHNKLYISCHARSWVLATESHQ